MRITARRSYRGFILYVGIAFILTALCLAAALLIPPRPSLYGDAPFSTAYYDRNGNLLRLTLAADEGYRLPAKLANINDDLINATLLQEDRYFYYHTGVNPFALLRGVYETYVARSRPMGGSTITMQLVRLRDDLDTRSIGGKLVQIYKALRLEAFYSKDDILEAYLNLAPYGGNIYGVRAASLIYFRQKPESLSLPQSLSLAVIPQNPVKRFPPGGSRKAWIAARNRLFAQLPQEQKDSARAVMALAPTTYVRTDLPFKAPHFVDGLIAENVNNAQKVNIKTTLDGDMQSVLENTVKNYITRNRFKGFDNAAAMLVHTPTMEVRALVGSVDFSDKTIDGQVDGTLAQRSPGSALKPFVYALALEQGLIHPETLLEDDLSYFAEYRPGNFDKKFSGLVTARDALVRSRNIPAISLAARLENPNMYDFLQQGGAGFPENQRHYGLSMVVGGAEIDMRAMVKLYAMLANQGQLRDLRFTDIKAPSETVSLLSPEAALLTLDMLRRPFSDAISFANTEPRLPVYWKTGTSNGFRDAWTVGIFGPYVLAVWVGHFDGRENPALIGTEAAAPLFFSLVSQIEKREPLTDRITPAIATHNIARIEVCRKTGLPEDCPLKQNSLFIPGKSPFAGKPVQKHHLRIASPREQIAYSDVSSDSEKLRIPLQADTNKETALHWFAGNKYLGQSGSQDTLFWSPSPGTYTIRVTDNQGNSDSRIIKVEFR